jgi:hypothetical protein
MLHKHLAKHPNHANANWHQRSVTGHVWHSDFVRRETKLKAALYRPGNEASDEQRKAYELLFGREGFRSQNICLVGVPASGKTWIAKKLSSLLQCVFFEKREIIRCAPIGRVACSFHPEARTIHCVMKLRPNARNYYPESLDELRDHMSNLPQDQFAELKALVISEAFMCTTPHLEVLLTHIKKTAPNCVLLFDGDSMQVTMKATTGYPSQPFLTRNQFQIVCPETQIIVLEKCLKLRIKNPIKLAHLARMRLGKATQETVNFFLQERITPQQQPVTRLFANTQPAARFNDDKLQEILNSNQQFKLETLQANDTFKDSGSLAKMSFAEEASLPVDASIKVVKGAPILIVQNHVADMCFDSGKKVYVGNGTTGTFWECDKQSDTIIAKLSVGFVRIKRRIFSTETKRRSQFPIMLAWAATVHKVQGMEFPAIEVDFGLLERSNDKSDFYQGLAYMALSRAETVVVKGRLTVGLLNNINLHSLTWWLSEIEKWNAFKVAKVTSSKVFRNAVHQHNWQAAALQTNVRKIVAQSRSHVTNQDPAPAPGPVPALALLRVPDTAPPLASAPAPAPDDEHTHATALGSALTPAPDPVSDAVVSDRQFSSRKRQHGAHAPAPTPAPAAHDEEALFHVDWDSASRQMPSVIGHTKLRLPMDWWHTNKGNEKWIQKHSKTIQDMWNETTEELNTYSINWEKGIPLFHSEGFGEIELELCTFLQRKHAAHSFCNTTPIHLQNFVDIGSGLGKAVCFMAALQPQFKSCFGIELLSDRHAQAAKQANLFAQKSVQKFVPFCPVSLAGGSCLVSDICRDKLMNAGLVWINNFIFSTELNQSILQLLTDTVPKGCIVVSFKEIMLTHRKGSTKHPSAFQVISAKELVADACNWSSHDIPTFTIQKT